MKWINCFIILALLTASTHVSSAPDPATFFKIAIKSDNTGSSLNNQFTIPTFPNTTYLYHVDCDGDGSFDAINLTGDYTCNYSSAGVYQVHIFGGANDGTEGFHRIYFNNSGDKDKVIRLDQWGNSQWSSMQGAFYGASNMIMWAVDFPDLNAVTSMESMFNKASLANPNTSNWETGSVTSMIRMFSNATSANPNTSNWDTSIVENMEYMFYLAGNANPDTSLWNTSKVTSMRSMFSNAGMANPDTSLWDTSQVIYMPNMFDNAISANPNTSLWDTSQVIQMNSMFEGATSAIPDTSQWDTSLVQDMTAMFKNAELANPATQNWNIESILALSISHKGYSDMFTGIKLTTDNYDFILNHFASQNVRSDLELGGGNSNLCTATSAKFYLENTENWAITDAGQNCSSETDDFVIVVKTDNPGSSSNTQFTIPAFTNLGGPSYNYNVSCQDNNAFNAGAITGSYTCNYSTPGTYRIRIVDNSGNGTGFSRIYFNNSGDRLKLLDVRQWGSGHWNVNMQHAFWGASNMIVTAKDTPDFSGVVSMQGMFRGATRVNPHTKNWDVSNVNDMRRMFAGAENVNPDTSLWDTSLVGDMSLMFWHAYSTNPDMSNWTIGEITTMQNMFVDVTLPITTYDDALINFAGQAHLNNVNLNAGLSEYCDGYLARAQLINDGWNILDLGQECTPSQPLPPIQLSSFNINTPTIQIHCTEANNLMKIYLTGDNAYNNALVGTFVCPGDVSMNVIINAIIPDGGYIMTAAQSKNGDESLPSNNQSTNLQIDTTVPDPTFLQLSPNPAANGVQVILELFQIEWGATVSVVGMICAPNPADQVGLVDCSGIVGQNGLDGSNNTITLIDIHGNTNTNNSTGLIVDNSPPEEGVFTDGFEDN